MVFFSCTIISHLFIFLSDQSILRGSSDVDEYDFSDVVTPLGYKKEKKEFILRGI